MWEKNKTCHLFLCRQEIWSQCLLSWCIDVVVVLLTFDLLDINWHHCIVILLGHLFGPKTCFVRSQCPWPFDPWPTTSNHFNLDVKIKFWKKLPKTGRCEFSPPSVVPVSSVSFLTNLNVISSRAASPLRAAEVHSVAPKEKLLSDRKVVRSAHLVDRRTLSFLISDRPASLTMLRIRSRTKI